MSRKAFNIYVELDIHAVTCPGTWLYPIGKVILRVTMLGTKVRTSSMTPVFPLLYHEKFIFQKTFSGSCCLSEVERIISQEVVLAELVQWPDANADIVLASFETTLLELLYPSPCDKGLISGVDVDLLMEPSPKYPGILAPKIEVSTKTTIEEVTKSSCSSQDISCNIINPKMLSSKGCTLPKRRKKVFHSLFHPKKCQKLRGRSCWLKKPPTTRNHCNHPHKHPSCFPPEHCPPFKHDRRHKCYACLETYKDECVDPSPSQPPAWRTASGRVYNSHTFCKTVNRPERAGLIVDCSHSHKKEDCFPHSMCECKNHTPGKCTVCNAYNKYFKPASTHCSSHCPQTIKKKFPCPNSRGSRLCDKYIPNDNSIFENMLPCSPRCGQTSSTPKYDTRHCTVDSGKADIRHAANKSLQCGNVKLDGGTKLHDQTKFDDHTKPSWKPCKPAPQPRSCPPGTAKSVLQPKSCPPGVFDEPLRKAQDTHEILKRHLNYAQNYPFLEEKEYHSSLKYPCNLHPTNLWPGQFDKMPPYSSILSPFFSSHLNTLCERRRMEEIKGYNFRLTSKDDDHTCSSYREMFYSGLEKFYKKLHNRYKTRAGEVATCS